MSEENEDAGKQEYKGLGKTAAALGQSSVDAAKGLAGGAVIGGAIGAILHNKETHETAKAFNRSILESVIHKDKQTFEKLTEGLTNSQSLKNTWNSFGRGGKVTLGAIAVGISVAIISQVAGLFRGYKKAKAGEKQFDTITAENRELKNKISGIETAAALATGNQKSYVADIENQRAKQAAQGASVAG